MYCSKSKAKPTSSLFDEDNIFYCSKSKTKPTSSLFDEDNIFYCSKSKAKPTSSLFDEDEEEDLFTGTKSTAKKSTPQKVGSL